MSGDLGAFITANFAYIYLSLWQFYLSVLVGQSITQDCD